MEVFTTDEFETWFANLQDGEQESVVQVVTYLETAGLQLGYPHASAIEGSAIALRELRPKRGKSPLRILYAFDPRRDAVLLVGGNKGTDAKFYKRMGLKAEAIWTEYLAEQAAGQHEKEEGKG